MQSSRWDLLIDLKVIWNLNRFKSISKLCFPGLAALPWVSKCSPFISSGCLWDEKRFQVQKRQNPKSASGCDCSHCSLALPLTPTPGLTLVFFWSQDWSRNSFSWGVTPSEAGVWSVSCLATHIHRTLHQKARVNRQLRQGQVGTALFKSIASLSG